MKLPDVLEINLSKVISFDDMTFYVDLTDGIELDKEKDYITLQKTTTNRYKFKGDFFYIIGHPDIRLFLREEKEAMKKYRNLANIYFRL